nr:histidine N-acetyltransferase-like [Nothobranchius furzeri]
MGDAFGLVYCLAKEEDYEQVMKICTSKDYNGLDYLPAFFHRWLKEPGRIVLLAWMKDRVVALESALLVDGGQTVMFQGRRVVSDLRGSGIAGVLHSHVTSYVRSQYPEVCAVRMSRGDHPSERILSKYRLVAKETGVLVIRASLEENPDQDKICGMDQMDVNGNYLHSVRETRRTSRSDPESAPGPKYKEQQNQFHPVNPEVSNKNASTRTD